MNRSVEQWDSNYGRFPSSSDLGSISVLSGELDGRSIDRIWRAASQDPRSDLELFLHEAQLIYHSLPEGVRSAIIDFRLRSNSDGALLVRPELVDPVVPPTPLDVSTGISRSTYFSELWLAIFGCALGDPIGYPQERSGDIFQNVRPSRRFARMLSSESSEISIDLHTENSFHPFAPDYVLLYCLRPDPLVEATTLVSGVRNIMLELDAKSMEILSAASFRTGIDVSFGSPDGRGGDGPLLPVLFGKPQDPMVRYDPDLMSPINGDATAALYTFASVARNHVKRVVLSSGDLLLIDNRRAVHGRAPFIAHYNGRDRWTQRTYVIRDLSRADEYRLGERIIAVTF